MGPGGRRFESFHSDHSFFKLTQVKKMNQEPSRLFLCACSSVG
ncbi:hypothetical protein ENHY17A_170010 [Moraxellaceae bacterium 17A]|nr:hypothetical protein ENHY17A_170010 [Moraxellaceae bacterium 17A]